jgi:hypothetical protein
VGGLAVVLPEVLPDLRGQLRPLGLVGGIVHVGGEVGTGLQLLVPQRLDVVGAGAPRGVSHVVGVASIHPGFVVFVQQITLVIDPVLERALDAGLHRRVELSP